MVSLFSRLSMLFILLLSCTVYGQGITFEEDLTWSQIRNKAKAENKYIFIDCFATWCGPCKMMDKNIYTNSQVGSFFNDQFISVKVQMDSTAGDAAFIKSWYADANKLKTQYKVGAFPSYLFFTPAGELVHKDIGFKDTIDLAKLGRNALDPQRQYYPLLAAYSKGRKDTAVMPYLVSMSNTLGEKETAARIARDYMDNHLLKLDDNELYEKKNIAFIIDCISLGMYKSTDKGIQFLFRHEAEVNRVMGDPIYVQKYLDYCIAKEYIDPNLWQNGKAVTENPDWQKMSAIISKKYNENYAARTILGAQDRWYGWKQQWPEQMKYKVLLVEKYGTHMNNIELNIHAWSVFEHSHDTTALRAAVRWVERVLQQEPEQGETLDTYANLLYKLKQGNKKDWLRIEEKGVRLTPGRDDIAENYRKMKNDEPTWKDN